MFLTNNNQFNSDFLGPEAVDALARVDASVVLVRVLDPQGLAAGLVTLPHEVDLLPVLAPLDHRSRIADDGADDPQVFTDPADLFHLLLFGLRRT